MIPVAPIGAATPPATPADAKTVGRAGTASKAALAFERQLVTQLTKQLAESMKPEAGDGESSSGAATGAYMDMLPETLADSIMQAGGIGLAAQLAPALTEQAK